LTTRLASTQTQEFAIPFLSQLTDKLDRVQHLRVRIASRNFFGEALSFVEE
jgi:hypothetical protein